jgi:hypothetical protein
MRVSEGAAARAVETCVENPLLGTHGNGGHFRDNRCTGFR